VTRILDIGCDPIALTSKKKELHDLIVQLLANSEGFFA